MPLNCGARDDSWESLGLHGDEASPSQRKSTLNIHWKGCCLRWSSNNLATWWEDPTHLKRPWCWERLKAGGEGDNRGWDGWVASVESVDMCLNKFWKRVKDREAWHPAVHRVAFQTPLSDWTRRRTIDLGVMPVGNYFISSYHCLQIKPLHKLHSKLRMVSQVLVSLDVGG